MKTKTILRTFLLALILVGVFVASAVKAGVVENPQEAVDDGNNHIPETDTGYSISFPGGEKIESIQLMAQSGSQIEFQSQNGVTIQGKPAQMRQLPHLVLFRNGELTDSKERTLQITINGLSAPTTGITLTIQLQTQHPDPDLWATGRTILSVWEITQRIENQTAGEPIVITHTFAAESSVGGAAFPTPSDYYRMQVVLTDAQHPIDRPLIQYVEEFAFLLESQWEFELPPVREEAQGAAPDSLLVYYCDMFPYQIDYLDAASRLPRMDVGAFVRDELGPAMVDAYADQSGTWGFTWYSAWTSYRSGMDAERLSVAMTMPGVWYHGRAPSSAHSGISINTTHKDYARYDRLSDGMLSAFHHELFHNIQRNINLKQGGDGDIDGEGDALAFITEGMATMASSVGQPKVEFVTDGSYLTQANTFLSGGKFYEPGLNTRYADLDPYRASIYWRFLYEQCGGLEAGRENPGRGMQVIRQTLETLYDQSYLRAAELADLLPELMDRVLEQDNTCPFDSYRQSLVHFSKTIYALRLNDLCLLEDMETLCGLYDPQTRYANPPVEEISFSGNGSEYSGSIPNSYGMDFIEVAWLAEKISGNIEIEFHNLSAAAEFDVQLLMIEDLEPGLTQGSKKRTKVQNINHSIVYGENRVEIYVDRAQEGERIALLITRLDSEEIFDPVGEYSLSLR